jgi:hypothetical protein
MQRAGTTRSYHPKIKSDTWPSTLFFGEVVAGLVAVATGNAGALTPGMLGPHPRCGCGADGFSATPARLNAEVAGASLMGVPGVGVGVFELEAIGGSSTAIALD